ncbi:MAG: glycosyltransferase family 9 protein [Deltaproteobacteria bacterium]|nr:glycosyltransferase family 9 protein [Deltaproteobacteria bacterium]
MNATAALAEQPVRVLPSGLTLGAGSRIAIVRLGAIGDVVNTMPLLVALREALPEAHLTWVIEPKSWPILEGHRALDEHVLFPRHDLLAQGAAFVRALRARRFDVVLDTQRLLKSAAVSLATGCHMRVGFDRRRSKEGNWLFATAHLPPREGQAPMIDQFREFAAALGLPLGPVRWDLPITEVARERAAAALEGIARPYVVLNLGASKPENLWPAERWAELTLRLGDALGRPVLWTGGPQDVERARAAAAHASPARDLVGATDLKTLAVVLGGASVVVSCDTGPMHIAVAMGAPVVGLFGPADPNRTGPYGWLDHVVTPRDGSRDMRDLAVDDVLASVRRVVAKHPRGEGAHS